MGAAGRFYVGVKQNIYDFDTVYELAVGFLDGTIYNRIQYLLERKDGVLEGTYYQNTKWLIKKIEQKRKKEVKK